MRRSRTIIGWCCLAAMGLLSSGAAWAADPPAAAAQQVDFRFKFEAGRAIRQRLVSKTVGDLKILGPTKFQQTFEQQLLTRCRKVNADGSAVLDMTIEAVALRQSMGPMTIEFDSRTWKPNPSNMPVLEMLGKLFSSMAGTTFTMTVDANGEPTKVEGLNEAMNKALAQLGEDKDSAMLRKMFKDMISAMGDENVMQQFRSFGRLTPPKQGVVKVGEKWSHDWSMKSLPLVAGGLEGKGEYELLGVQSLNGRQCIRVRVKENFKMTPPDAQAAKPDADSPLAALFNRVKMELSSSGGDGIGYIDAQTGDVISLRQTQNIELKISAAADPQDPDENTRDGIQPMSMKFRVSISVDTLDGAADAPTKAQSKPAEEKSEK